MEKRAIQNYARSIVAGTALPLAAGAISRAAGGRRLEPEILEQQKAYINSIDNLTIGKNDYPAPVGWSPSQERFDLINPGFFERVYRRGRPPT